MNTEKILATIKNLGINKINEQNPTGIDPRYEDLYAILQNEINKLSSATAGGTINWTNVADTCINILQTLSKDIPSACYLPIALAYANNETDKNSGFVLWLAGSQELFNLLKTFWDTAFPAKKRIKGRVNALQWWLDRSKILLESEPFLATEISEANFNDANEFINNLDNFFAENLADNDIVLYELKQLVKNIPVKIETPKVEEVKIENTETNNEKIAEVKTETTTENTAETKEVIKEAETVIAKKTETEHNNQATQANQANQVIPKNIPTQSIDLDIKNLPDLSVNIDTKTIQNALRQIANSVITLFTNENNEVLSNDIFLWKIIYCSLWGNLTKLPPCSDNKNITFLPEPDIEFIGRISKMIENKNHLTAIKMILQNLYVSVFLFDLHYYLILCLKQLGGQYSAVVNTIEFEFYNLLNRLKNIEELCFENKTPFANNKTKLWITQIKKSFQNSNSNSDDNADNDDNDKKNIFENLNNQCDKLVAENKLTDALILLDNQSLQYKLTDPKCFLSIKLKQLELLADNNFLDLAFVLSQNLEQICLNNKIAYWQPNLWIKFWKLTYLITQKIIVSNSENKNDNNYIIATEFNKKAMSNLMNLSISEAVKIK